MFTNQRGSALLSALFIMTLVAITTTTLTIQFKNRLEDTRLMADINQLQIDSVILRSWSMNFLTQEKTRRFGQMPGKNTHFEKKISFPSLPNTDISIEIIDLNARFNLNNLKYPSSKTTFYHLTKHLLEDGQGQKSYTITSTLTDWINEYQPGNKKNNAHFIPHIPMVSLSEITSIQTLDPKDIDKLTPYLTVLPTKSAVNINTAPEELLMAMALNGQDTLKNMEALLHARGDKGIQSLNDISQILKALSIEVDDVILESEYFLSIGRMKRNGNELTRYSLLKRSKDDDGKYTIQLIHETWNTD